MSLYRQAGRRSIGTVVAALLAGLIVGGLAGYLIGEGSEEEPSLVDAVAELNRDAEPLRLAMDQVAIEYPGTVRDGEVVSPTEYEASVASAERAASTLREISIDLMVILEPGGFGEIASAVRDLQALLRQRAPEPQVKAQVAVVERALGGLGTGEGPP
jgi:hypothetical protein